MPCHDAGVIVCIVDMPWTDFGPLWHRRLPQEMAKLQCILHFFDHTRDTLLPGSVVYVSGEPPFQTQLLQCQQFLYPLCFQCEILKGSKSESQFSKSGTQVSPPNTIVVIRTVVYTQLFTLEHICFFVLHSNLPSLYVSETH